MKSNSNNPTMTNALQSNSFRRRISRSCSSKVYSCRDSSPNSSNFSCCTGRRTCESYGISNRGSFFRRSRESTAHELIPKHRRTDKKPFQPMTQSEVVYVHKDPTTKQYIWSPQQLRPLITNPNLSPYHSPFQSSQMIRSAFSNRNNQDKPIPISNLRFSKTFSSDIKQKTRPVTPRSHSGNQYNERSKPKSAICRGPMDWKNYHRLAVIDSFMDNLETKYPSLCTVRIIGKSIEGRHIKLLKVSDSHATNTAVWIDSGIHAREWIGPAVNTYVANHIVKYFNSLPEYVTNKDWYFLPVINPDGYEYSHTENRMWRKNRAKIKGICVGVDLNRNFSFGWGGKGSSDNPTHNFYRGSAPFSEPEAQAVRDYITNSNINFKVYITLHSYGQVIILPFACREDLCPNYIKLLQGATVMSKAIFETNGNVYKVGISKDVMYNASGTSNDWSHGVMNIPYCYLIELRSRKHKFKLPQEEIEETGKEILNCLIRLMEHLHVNEYL